MVKNHSEFCTTISRYYQPTIISTSFLVKLQSLFIMRDLVSMIVGYTIQKTFIMVVDQQQHACHEHIHRWTEQWLRGGMKMILYSTRSNVKRIIPKMRLMPANFTG